MIEPVVESLVQLLVQSILVYIVLGPSDSGNIGQQSLMMDDKYTKQIITSHNAIYNANCAKMPNVHLMF